MSTIQHNMDSGQCLCTVNLAKLLLDVKKINFYGGSWDCHRSGEKLKMLPIIYIIGILIFFFKYVLWDTVIFFEKNAIKKFF